MGRNTRRSAADGRSGLERALGLVTEVRAGEGACALLFTLNIFFLLTAYYVIKPVREGLILEMKGGAEYKAYMSAAIAIALLFAVPAYSRVAKKIEGNRLVIGVTLFFASHLVLFYVASLSTSLRTETAWLSLGFARIPVSLGLVFYLWLGMFNMMVIAQFWAFANDVYSEEEGTRLFALVGIGASVGAALGSGVASILVKPLGTFPLLLVSAGLLGACAVLTEMVHRRSRRARVAPRPVAGSSRAGAFALVFRTRYLFFIALFSVLFTFVNSNGEYMLGKLIQAVAREEAGSLGVRDVITQQYGTFYLSVNVLGILLQTFLVSRLVRGGLRIAFFILPAIALANAIAVSLVPALLVLRLGKTMENATDYSLNNTVRAMLWLPTTREMKYRAKQAVDSFFIRLGDVSSAILVYAGAELLGWEVRGFALSNIVLVALWIWVARRVLAAQAPLRA